MVHVVADRIRETGTLASIGTGAIPLTGTPSTAFRTFASVCAVNDTLHYCVVSGGQWEVGLGTYSAANTLNRTTVLASSNAGALVNFGAVSKEVYLTNPAAAVKSQPISVLQFGAVGDGVANDTAAINSAIAAAAGKALYIPAGSYKYTALNTPANNTKIHGDGRGTRLICSAATGNSWEFGDGVSEIRNIELRDLTFWSSVTRTSGAMIRARKLVRSNIKDVYFGTAEDFNADGNRLFDGITINEFDNVRIEGGYCLTSNDGITAYGNAAQDFGSELFLDGGLRVLRQASKCIHIAGGAGGVKIDNIDVSVGVYGLYVSDDLGLARNREIFIGSRASFDSHTTGNGRGIWFDANSCDVAELVGTWCGSNKVGIDIRAAQFADAKFKFTGIRVYNNQNEGVIIADGNVIISGSAINDNGAVLAGAHGLDISAANTKGIVISGNQIVGNGTSGASYNINVAAGCDNFNISDNILTGGTAGAVQNASGVGTTKIVRDNIGWVTENGGTGSIASGATSATITHGLAGAPAAKDIWITPTELTNNDPGPFYVNGITATQFVVNCRNDPGVSNQDFSWGARII